MVEIQQETPSGNSRWASAVESIAKVRYHLHGNTGRVTVRRFQLHGNPEVALRLAGEPANSRSGLWFYLKNQAKAGDTLFIDGPEVHLDRKQARQMARLVRRLATSGVNLVISTPDARLVLSQTCIVIQTKKSAWRLP